MSELEAVRFAHQDCQKQLDRQFELAKQLRIERDEARHVAYLLWRERRLSEERGPKPLRLAARYPWLNVREEVLE